MKMLNVIRLDEKNCGDKWSSPVNYFDFLKRAVSRDASPRAQRPGESLAIWEEQEFNDTSEDYAIIAGGGGLLTFKGVIPFLSELKKKRPTTKLIFWGAGCNSPSCLCCGLSPPLALPPPLESWDLAGVRDFNHGYIPGLIKGSSTQKSYPVRRSFPWVSCPSCLHEAFDSPYESQHALVVYEHKDHPFFDTIDSPKIPVMSNETADIDEVISFLGSGDTILTNTYHGVVWATLLNKKVIIFEPFSTKFFGLKHKQPTCTRYNWKEKVGEGVNYPLALEECRASNINFSKKVKKCLLLKK